MWEENSIPTHNHFGGTENPNPTVPPAGFDSGPQMWNGEERNHQANPTFVLKAESLDLDTLNIIEVDEFVSVWYSWIEWFVLDSFIFIYFFLSFLERVRLAHSLSGHKSAVHAWFYLSYTMFLLLEHETVFEEKSMVLFE